MLQFKQNKLFDCLYEQNEASIIDNKKAVNEDTGDKITQNDTDYFNEETY